MKSKVRAPKFTLQQLLINYLPETIKTGQLNSYQQRVLYTLQQCKTASLGGHWQACDSCGVANKHYNSCGNRHCPGCQGTNRERWVLEREYDMFDVPYHHVTFTVPQELRSLFYQNQKELYDILFNSMWGTLLSFSKDPKSRLEADIGVISILHTWTQKLEYHPHLHCIVPDGGLQNGNWKHGTGKFLLDVKSLSSVFKGKFCDALKLLHKKGELKQQIPQNEYDFERFLTGLKRKKWVVNSKPGFNGKTSVLEYLGRYTHKIAISNYRLISLKDEVVTFSYRDRRAGDIKRIMSLPVKEFIVRFSRHILPSRFVKIRHYGIFSTRNKRIKLPQVRASLGDSEVPKPEKLNAAEVLFVTQGIDVHQCKECKEGKMVVVKLILSSRGSPHRLPSLDRALLYE